MDSTTLVDEDLRIEVLNAGHICAHEEGISSPLRNWVELKARSKLTAASFSKILKTE